MALRKLTDNRPETPYFRPPPVHIRVLKCCDQLKVISWDIKDGGVKPLLTKKNKVAAITDGETLVKITLFEEFSSKVKQDMSYMMRGHELRGQAPPYLINITSKTQFFRAPALPVSEALVKKAEELLEPPSPPTPLKMSPTSGGLMTVEGEVVESSGEKDVLAVPGSIRSSRGVSTLESFTTCSRSCAWMTADSSDITVFHSPSLRTCCPASVRESPA
ncbi:uncharacterized protein LOC120434720 [Oreochromis aureus]|uniref:uncharacterized protein LOC120434720 n=1 Tax=Oreochromis aureus TaxID=47969 RepID=UPI0019531880|nr:uncharacterized protein LOC120434720 [Oreochromis aureus]